MNLFRLKSLILLPVYLLLLGCKQNNADKAAGIATIEIAQNLGKYQAVSLSEFVTELEYIPLETDNDCLIAEVDGTYSHIIVTSSHIFVAGYRFCYAFGRDGRFIGNIGSFGQGPEEYRMINGLSIDENKQSVYIDTHNSVMEYSYDGVFHRSFQTPKTQILFHDRIQDNYMNNVYFVRDNLFIGHTGNPMGNEKYHFHLIDNLGQMVKSFDNQVQFNRPNASGSIHENAMRPYRVSENVYVKEMLNDTLYCLNVHNELIPQFVFDLGQYTYSKKNREDTKWNNPVAVSQMRVIFISNASTPAVVGTPESIFFSYEAWNLSGQYTFPERVISQPLAGTQNVLFTDNKRHLGIYDIINRRTQLLDTDPISHSPGLINDLDGGLPFWPKYYTPDNELIDIWQAYEMKEMLTEQYFAGHEIKNPQAHQKLRELLKNLDEYDNPVVVIAKSKK
jgi:hypothetical protein